MAVVRLSFFVESPDVITQIYDQIKVERNVSTSDEASSLWLPLDDMTVPGYNDPQDHINLVATTTSYLAYDTDGEAEYWYRSYYYGTVTSGVSGYSTAVQGEAPDLFYDPLFPPELDLSAEEKQVVDRIRLLIGDPIGLRREYGEEAASSIHPDGKTYELDEKGWPVSITMAGTSYNSTLDPTINGYKYLIFSDFIDTTTVVCSGTRAIEYGVDIWYYTFRWSDRQILEAYNNSPPPPGLTTTNATAEAYMLYTAITLLGSGNWHDGIEDGAVVKDEGTVYDPSPGFDFRSDLLDDLNKRLDDVVQSLVLRGIEGVRVE